MGWWSRWFGILLGALSLFGLVKQHWDFKLAPFAAHFLEFYRSIVHPPAELIGWLISWVIWVTPPPDLVVIWVVMGTALTRHMLNTNPGMLGETGLPNVSSLFWIGIWPYLLGAIVWPIILGAVIWDLRPKSRHRSSSVSALLGWSKEIAYVFGAFILIFGLNAGMA